LRGWRNEAECVDSTKRTHENEDKKGTTPLTEGDNLRYENSEILMTISKPAEYRFIDLTENTRVKTTKIRDGRRKRDVDSMKKTRERTTKKR